MTIDPGTRQALATFTARVSDGESVGGDLRDSRTLNVVFAEIGGEWLVQQVRFVRYP